MPLPTHTANVAGALALALADRMTEALAKEAPTSDATVLSALHHFLYRPSIDQVRRMLGLTHSGAVRLADRMEAAGLVTRGTGPDGRTSAIVLTTVGEARAARVTAARDAVLREALAPLSAADRAELDRIAGTLLVGMMRGPGATRWICRLCDTAACGRTVGSCPIGGEAHHRRTEDTGGEMDIAEINRRTIARFREGGPIEGMQRDRLLLLTTTGRRTGTARTTPMMFHRDADRLYVIASNVGAPKHPDWYLNLEADPVVTVEIGDEAYPAVADPLAGEDRARVWSDLKRAYPFFADHEAATDRTIPVVALTRS